MSILGGHALKRVEVERTQEADIATLRRPQTGVTIVQAAPWDQRTATQVPARRECGGTGRTGRSVATFTAASKPGAGSASPRLPRLATRLLLDLDTCCLRATAPPDNTEDVVIKFYIRVNFVATSFQILFCFIGYISSK